MKIRQYFVSNSSSSSFILSAPSGIKELEVTLKVDLNKDIFAVSFKDLDSWTKHIEKEYGWGKCTSIEKICEEEEFKEIYDKGKAVLESGNEILWLCPASDSDSPIDRLFHENPMILEKAAEQSGCVILGEF